MKLYEVLDSITDFICIKFVGRDALHFMTGYNAYDIYSKFNVKRMFWKNDVTIYEIYKEE